MIKDGEGFKQSYERQLVMKNILQATKVAMHIDFVSQNNHVAAIFPLFPATFCWKLRDWL